MSRIVSKKYVVELDDGTIRKDPRCTSKNTLDFIQALCTSIIRKPIPGIVPVYSFNIIKEEYYNFHYEYVMRRLQKLNSFEKMIIYAWSDQDSVNEIWNDYKRKYSEEETNAILRRGKEVHPDLFELMSEYKDRYFDIHPGNIMKDDDGTYLLIDLEGFDPVVPLNDSKNDWFMKR